MAVNGFEYRSDATILGLPLLHVAYGTDPLTGTRRVARGVIAVGQAAFGVVAVGQLAIGVVSVGQLSVGLALGVGQLAAGIAVLGQFAAGIWVALGQFASALYAVGQVSVCGAAFSERPPGWMCSGAAPAAAGIARGLAYAPILAVWGLAAAGLAIAVAHEARRARRARALPRGEAVPVRGISAGPVKLRARVAETEGTVLLASAAERGRRAAPADFLVGDEGGQVLVRVADAEFWVPAEGNVARLDGGDTVTVCGVAERHADPGGEAAGYREAPTRWTIGGEVAVVGKQDDAVVRATARLLPLLARLYGLAAVAASAYALWSVAGRALAL